MHPQKKEKLWKNYFKKFGKPNPFFFLLLLRLNEHICLVNLSCSLLLCIVRGFRLFTFLTNDTKPQSVLCFGLRSDNPFLYFFFSFFSPCVSFKHCSRITNIAYCVCVCVCVLVMDILFVVWLSLNRENSMPDKLGKNVFLMNKAFREQWTDHAIVVWLDRTLTPSPHTQLHARANGINVRQLVFSFLN